MSLKDKILSILKRNRTIVANFGYLSILQLLTLVLPLLVIPYLLKVLGDHNYGLVVYAQAIIQYFVIIVNFGFNISATKDVSIHRDEPRKLSEIVSSVLILKIILFLLSFLSLCIIVFSIPSLRDNYLLYFFCMGFCLSEVIFPVWFFQGIEKMRYITFVNVVSRVLFTLCIFLFIKHPHQFLYVPLLNGVGATVGGAIALWIVFKHEKVRFKLQSLPTLFFYFKESAPLFLTRASAQVYVRTNIVIVGSFLGMAEAAYYDVALKVVSALSMPFNTLKTAIFPKVSKDLNIQFVHKTIKLVLLLAFGMIVFIQFTGDYVMELLCHTDNLEAGKVLRLLSLILVATVMSGFFGEQLLIPFGKKKSYVRGMVSTAIFYFIALLTMYLLNFVNLYSIVLLVVATEYFLSFFFLISCKKYKLL